MDDRRPDEAPRADPFARANAVRDAAIETAAALPGLGLTPGVIHVAPEDLVVLRSARRLSAHDCQRIKAHWEAVMPKVAAIVLDDDMTIGVLRREEPWTRTAFLIETDEGRRTCRVRVAASLYVENFFTKIPVPAGCRVAGIRGVPDESVVELLLTGHELPIVPWGKPVPLRSVIVHTRRDENDNEVRTTELADVVA